MKPRSDRTRRKSDLKSLILTLDKARFSGAPGSLPAGRWCNRSGGDFLESPGGERVTWFGPSAIHFYNEHEEAVIRAAMEAAPALRTRTERPAAIAKAEEI